MLRDVDIQSTLHSLGECVCNVLQDVGMQYVKIHVYSMYVRTDA